jgi:hypothetical protein
MTATVEESDHRLTTEKKPSGTEATDEEKKEYDAAKERDRKLQEKLGLIKPEENKDKDLPEQASEQAKENQEERRARKEAKEQEVLQPTTDTVTASEETSTSKKRGRY